MSSTATGITRSRAVYAAVFALVSVIVAGFGHAAGHGAAPTSAGVAGALVAALAIGALVSGSRWSPPRLIGALAAVQALVHGAAWVAGGPGGPVDPRLEQFAASTTTAHGSHAPFTVRMLAAHLAAVVVAALLLAAIEHAAALVASAARRLGPSAQVPVPSLSPAVLRRDVVVARPAAPHLVVVRGHAPPVLLGT